MLKTLVCVCLATGASPGLTKAHAAEPGPALPAARQGANAPARRQPPINRQPPRIAPPNVRAFTFGNGLRLIVVEDHRAPSFAMQLIVRR